MKLEDINTQVVNTYVLDSLCNSINRGATRLVDPARRQEIREGNLAFMTKQMELKIKTNRVNNVYVRGL